MYRCQEEKEEYIEKIFSDKTLFEWEVLHVSSHYDRVEIMQIISNILVREKLKYELNFLHIKEYRDFKFSQIVNIIFHEIANEWLTFATNILYCSKKEAIEALQDKTRVIFIHSLSVTYYKKYKRQIFEEVANTFIELVSSAKNDKATSVLIEKVLKSDMIKNKQILSMHDFSQLYKRVKIAQGVKNKEVERADARLMELKRKYESQKNKNEKNEDEIKRLFKLFKKAKIEFEKLQNKSLNNFDAGVSRLKDTMVHTMMRMNH
ncbi:hypothetical protein [Sulfurimonas sp.]|uniref:hypothetical protein n=1 Tax=Sulfurimonas sp. TaxID=2022749 RepID=UPI002AAFE50D|nr:hypothetical protein [Sulfurimonas sp.]